MLYLVSVHHLHHFIFSQSQVHTPHHITPHHTPPQLHTSICTIMYMNDGIRLASNGCLGREGGREGERGRESSNRAVRAVVNFFLYPGGGCSDCLEKEDALSHSALEEQGTCTCTNSLSDNYPLFCYPSLTFFFLLPSLSLFLPPSLPPSRLPSLICYTIRESSRPVSVDFPPESTSQRLKELFSLH